MRSLRHIAVHALLLVMGLMLVPKQWLHDHHHAEHGHGVVVTETACLICELTLQPAVMEVPPVLVAITLKPAVLPVPEVSGLALGFTFKAADRGPPGVVRS